MKKFFIPVIVILIAGITGFVFYYQKYHQGQPQVSQLHYSYFTQPGFYDNAYADATFQKYQPDAKGILVNHHLLAGNFIAEAFQTIATDAPVTVVLVSPNHFSAGQGNFITSAESWQTPYGILPADTKTIKKVGELLSVEEDPFVGEHGISGIVAFIKKSLPNARILPVIIRNTVTSQGAQQVADQLNQILPKNSLVVASFDFSHYLTNRAADFHDQESLEDVSSFDYAALENLDIDSRPGLIFSQKLLADFEAKNFTLLEHSNSAAVAHAEDTLETTSYITGYFSMSAPTSGNAGVGAPTASVGASQPISQSTETVLVFPPIANSTTVEENLNRYSPAWSVEYLERLFSGQDKTYINVENSDNSVINILKKYNFSNILSGQKDIKPFPNVLIHQQARSDSITVNKGNIVINQSGQLISDRILKTGGASIIFGFIQQDDNLQIIALPISVSDGVAKLLVGKQDDMMLEQLAKNSSPQIATQIRTGKVILKINN